MATVANEKQGNLPHFPDPQDPDQRIRMGCPEEGENLRWRYREVTGGDTPASWDEDDFLFGYNFEWALADLLACAVCEAQNCIQHHRLDNKGDEMPNGAPTWKEWTDCRSVNGRGYFMDYGRRVSELEGKPRFRMTFCHSPVTRKAQLARRQVSYHA